MYRFNRAEDGKYFFDLDEEVIRTYPELKGYKQVVMTHGDKGRLIVKAIKNNPTKKNIEGFRDQYGMFHPIRSGNKEQGRLYDGNLSGDNDDVFQKIDRDERNEEKREEIYEKRVMKELLDDALGDNKKQTLSQFVRKSGGLFYDPSDSKNPYRGELERLTFKQCKRRGLAHPKGKRGLDAMREQAAEAGYSGLNGNLTTVSDFIDALESDVSGNPIYPFLGGDEGLKWNPAKKVSAVYAEKIKQLTATIKLLTKNKKTAKAKKFQKVLDAAKGFMKAAKKRETPAKTTKKRAAKKPAPAKKPVSSKKPAAARKTKKNVGFASAISTLANVAVGTSAALDVHSRMSKKKKPTKKPAALKVSKPKKNRDESYHENQFELLLNKIEDGDFSKINAAKLQGKLAGFAANETNILIQRARLTHRLKTNPTAADLKAGETAMVKQNGIFTRYNERRKAGKFLKRELKLEAAIKKARAKLAAAKKKAVANPAKPNYSTKKMVGENQARASFEQFQGRESTKVLTLDAPESAPNLVYVLGVLYSLKIKGIVNEINYRQAVSGSTYYICADGKNEQLWIFGGISDNEIRGLGKGFAEPLGEIQRINYFTKKAHLGDKKPCEYTHKFGEEGGECPVLGIDRFGYGIVLGGSYTIERLGIRD